MSTDLSTFNPANIDALMAELESQGAATLGDWWTKNSTQVDAYLKSIATATLQTQAALTEGRISSTTAATLMQGQAAALKTTLEYAVFMSEVLAQKLVDSVIAVLAWAIYNKTGINIAPTVVKPAT